MARFDKISDPWLTKFCQISPKISRDQFLDIKIVYLIEKQFNIIKIIEQFWYNICYALIFVSEFDFNLFAIACSASSPAPESLRSIFRNDVFRSMPDERDCPPSNPIVFDTFHELSKL